VAGVSLLAFVLSTIGGCLIGPRMLPASNSSYSDAVRVAQSEQLLANLVRLHYHDLPLFLAVTDISTQFEINGSGTIGGSVNGKPVGYSAGAGAGVGYSERPTISFSILGGEAFQKRLLSPLDLGAISLLVESGWRVDRVLRLTVEQLNSLPNARSASGPTPEIAPEYAGFIEAATLWEKLRGSTLAETLYRTERSSIGEPLPVAQVDGSALVAASTAGFEFERAPQRNNSVQLAKTERRLVLRFSPDSDRAPTVQRLRELLRLKPGERTFDVVTLDDRSFDAFDRWRPREQLAVDTRSLMGVLYYLSNGVEAPPEHVAAGLVTPTVSATGAPFSWKDVVGDLVTIHSSRHQPGNAAIAIEYRGYWFYVADDDRSTKSTFMLLSELFALQAGELSRTKPVLTLPVGG